MQGKKPKPARVGRLARAALLLGVATATASALVLSAGVAHASLGDEPGDVSLSPTSGATSVTPTWATTVACNTGFQGSAVFRLVEASGATTDVSAGTNSVTTAFTGTFSAPIATLQAADSIAAGTYELVIVCYSGASETGTASPEMDTWLTISGTSYTTSNTPPAAIATSTTLTASPNPATTGATVTLTATVTDSDSSTPAGSVQFESGGTDIGTPVTVASGTATTTTTFASAGAYSLTAVYTPTSPSYASSTSAAVSETVTAATTSTSGSEPLSVTVAATGSFTLTVATGTVTLTVSGATATGALNPVTVSDTRNTFPGWSVSGQESNFTGSGTAAGSTISGNQLGWVPTDTSLGTGVVLGSTVAPASPGLGTTAAVLASATAPNGAGTSVLGANLTLDIPASATAGPYAGVMTITAVTSLA
jgi:hypothetical protein